MLLLISPAKTLDFATPPRTKVVTQPNFLEHSQTLIDELRHLSPPQLSELMGISDKLGDLNFGRFLNWQTPFTLDNAKQAVLAFKGDVYTGMEAETFARGDFTFAQKHLRILSGLYGLLRPLDLIQPYRLEMGTPFTNTRGKNLYQFWGDIITDRINEELAALKSKVVVNLASNEYYQAVNGRRLDAEVITPVFKDRKNGQYKIISFFAKKARGMMSAYIIRERLKKPEGIKDFNTAGYAYNEAMSSPKEWVFTRDAEA
ncbi:peroxide stress protein YaaA [Cellvibrio sp. PSBB006]|uniref:peroxide stress protein YaaA n=1 Tax=Cellvibrio sp. PSBB006 TaxID=1987723 RepID=UPI000B3B144E|nr:peroxide stress protein YaaA [Cellvibrio sp. PSBB006]ARU28576.1 peroxide stress protein YaaA [Cellvibrio sp. PSBB006]